jgi:hypothetical protein
MSALATRPSTVFVFSRLGSSADPILRPLRSRLGNRVVERSGRDAPMTFRQRDIVIVVGADDDFLPVWDRLRWSRCRKLLVVEKPGKAVDTRLFDRVWWADQAAAAASVVEHVLHHAG